MPSPELKAHYLKEFETNKQIVFLDDDNAVLKKVMDTVDGIIVFQDSELVD